MFYTIKAACGLLALSWRSFAFYSFFSLTMIYFWPYNFPSISLVFIVFNQNVNRRQRFHTHERSN